MSHNDTLYHNQFHSIIVERKAVNWINHNQFTSLLLKAIKLINCKWSTLIQQCFKWKHCRVIKNLLIVRLAVWIYFHFKYDIHKDWVHQNVITSLSIYCDLICLVVDYKALCNYKCWQLNDMFCMCLLTLIRAPVVCLDLGRVCVLRTSELLILLPQYSM